MRERVEAPSFICRCEEVTQAEVEGAISAGACTINDVKRRTRAGMGACQGVYCLNHIAAILALRTATPLAQLVPMTTRPPVRWITVSALAEVDQ